MTETTAPRFSAGQLAWQVGAATLNRFLINVSRRFPYPFAPALSRGLGVPLSAITALIAVNQATGLVSPLFGPLGDRWGYRVMLLAGLGLMSVGMLAGGWLPFYGAVLLALLLAGLGKSLFDPALQAYIGEHVPYRHRGLTIGLIEFSWAGSSLIGIPLAGLLIDRLGWQAPFLALGGLGLVGLVALVLLIPPDRHHRQQQRTGFAEAWRLLSRERTALGGLGFAFLTSMSNDNLFVVYGAWLEQSFELGLVAVGTATTVIGIAELMGESLTASLADRLGLKRSIITGLFLSTLSYLLLPLAGRSLTLALVGLFVTFITFEFTIVSSFSFFTEVLPPARATLMSALLALSGLGRVVGALMGGFVWLHGGILVVGLVSAAISGLALLSFWWGSRHW